MQFSDRDYASLWDMVQAIRLIQEFVTPLTVELDNLLAQLELLLPDEL